MIIKLKHNSILIKQGDASNKDTRLIHQKNMEFLNNNTTTVDLKELTIHLSHKGFVFGRNGDINHLSNDSSISRKHFKIFKHALGHWIIKDLNSTNGTFIFRNNKKYQLIPEDELKLETQDKIYINENIFLFEILKD